MNHLAMAVWNLSNGRDDLERFHLTPSELSALKSIGSLIRLSPIDMESFLQKNDDPTDWLINPLSHDPPKAAD